MCPSMNVSHVSNKPHEKLGTQWGAEKNKRQLIEVQMKHAPHPSCTNKSLGPKIPSQKLLEHILDFFKLKTQGSYG